MPSLSDLARDAVGLLGAGLVTYGAWQIYVPAGFIVGGGMMMFAAWRLARAG